MMNTRVQKGRDGWEAKTMIDMGAKNRVLAISTHKTDGGMVTSATVHTEKDGYLSTILFQDFNKRTVHAGVRCTEKAVTMIHQLALDAVADTLAEAAKYYDYKERVENYEDQGMTTSDAQGVVDAEILQGYTAQDVLDKLAREAGEPVKALPSKPVTCDQVDLFQPQGGLFA